MLKPGEFVVFLKRLGGAFNGIYFLQPDFFKRIQAAGKTN